MTQTVRVGTLDVAYDASVLEPRPWTAAQAEWAAALALDLPPGPLLELCCGAGHIGLLAATLARRDAVLVDLSPAACAFAEENAAQVRAAGVSVSVRQGGMADVLDPAERFPLVLADPPYIPTVQTSHFPQDPLSAIDGGADGLELGRLCLEVSSRHLASPGALVLQVRDEGQARALMAHGQRLGLGEGEVRVVGDRGALLLMQRGS